MFHFLVWFGFGFSFSFFSLVSLLVWSRSRWTVRVACLSGLEADWRVYCGREAIKDRYVWIGRMRRVVCYVVVVVVWIMSLFY